MPIELVSVVLGLSSEINNNINHLANKAPLLISALSLISYIEKVLLFVCTNFRGFHKIH
jgi:hypothetical protein